MDWNTAVKGFQIYLKLERSLSSNSIEAYLDDIQKLSAFSNDHLKISSPLHLNRDQLQEFIYTTFNNGLSDRTQARILSGVKAFYKYLMIEDVIQTNPTSLIEGPKLSQKIPDVLSIEEIQLMIEAIDLSDNFGHRDRAIIETLYACGIRVSECAELKCSLIFDEQSLIRVIGKGNKERLVPIGDQALQQINLYRNGYRSQLPKVKNHEDFLFLNKFGKKISRISIFNIVKKYKCAAGIEKEISPHSFRHSFATHLIEAGVNLKSVQEMLGHESITTTEIYTHINTHFLRDTILKFHPRNQRTQ